MEHLRPFRWCTCLKLTEMRLALETSPDISVVLVLVADRDEVEIGASPDTI